MENKKSNKKTVRFENEISEEREVFFQPVFHLFKW